MADPSRIGPSPSGVLVAEGWGLRLRVRRGMLEVRDEAGPDGSERTALLVRAGPRGRRIVLLGRAGTISVEALRWCADAGVGLALIDAAAGRVVMASGDLGSDIPSLRRAQALAPGSEAGLALTRYLITQKLDGQGAVLAEHFPEARGALREVGNARAGVARAGDPSAVRLAEARAAAAYWSAWEGVRLTFARKEESRIPEHWRRFGTRGSVLTGGPRLAASPANALLNYCYALAEVECRLACLAVGLDPGLGVLHADQRARDSMALDLLEAIRPDVDRFVLGLADRRTFTRRSFFETQRGVFRVGAALARDLAESLPLWRRQAAPVAEHVARMLGGAGLPTPLTQDRRSAGREGIRKEPRRTKEPRVRLPAACATCGAALRDHDRTLCDPCLADKRRSDAERYSRSGPARLAAMRAEGRDPTATPEARRRLAETMSARNRERASWDREHPDRPDPEAFRREVLPGLREVPLSRMVEATGLSLRHCSRIRRGEAVPHPRHWEALQGLASMPLLRGSAPA